jgi:hypothetical protein
MLPQTNDFTFVVTRYTTTKGDPISPLFYLFGSDLLQSAVNELVHLGKLSRPIETNDMDFPIIQYADDTLLILPADKDQLLALKEVLNKFSQSTGLKINFDKSQMVPINVSEEVIQQLAEVLAVRLGKCLLLIWVYHWGQSNQQLLSCLP